MLKSLLLGAALAVSVVARAEIVIRDDTGQEIRLAAPARRIVTLAPHAAESLFAAGAGDRLVGTVDYSDYPEAARKVQRIGGYSRVDLETVAALKPDLIIAWESGNASAQIDKLKAMGLKVFTLQPNRLEDVAGQLEVMGKLAGSEAVANAAAARFRERLAGLRKTYSAKPTVRVFYQSWKAPLMTVGGPQIISDVIRLCGGENVFGKLTQMAPTVSVEAVIEVDPEAIVVSGMGEDRPEWLDDWRPWTGMTAVKRGNLFHINPYIIQRHTPRLLDGAERLCGQLEEARARRPK